MIDDDVIDNEQSARMGCLDQALQILKAAPMRVNPVKIAARVAVELAPRVQDNGRNPNRRGAQGLNIIELLFQAFEVAAMDGGAAMAFGIIIAVGVVVGGVAVEKPVRDDLIDALALPQIVSGTRGCGHEEQPAAKQTSEGAGGRLRTRPTLEPPTAFLCL